MNNYEFLAMFEKINREEEKSNLKVGLIVILMMSLGVVYLLYYSNQEKNRKIARQQSDNDELKGCNAYLTLANSKLVNDNNTLRKTNEILKSDNIALNNLINEIQLKEANKEKV